VNIEKIAAALTRQPPTAVAQLCDYTGSLCAIGVLLNQCGVEKTELLKLEFEAARSHMSDDNSIGYFKCIFDRKQDCLKQYGIDSAAAVEAVANANDIVMNSDTKLTTEEMIDCIISHLVSNMEAAQLWISRSSLPSS
jgi:hypothetical protein